MKGLLLLLLPPLLLLVQEDAKMKGLLLLPRLLKQVPVNALKVMVVGHVGIQLIINAV